MAPTRSRTIDISLDELERALGLCSGSNYIPCWAGVSQKFPCTQDVTYRLREVLNLLETIRADLSTYDTVELSQGIPELLHRLAVELLCKEFHEMSPEILTEDIARALRQRLFCWEAARNGRPLELEQRRDKANPVRHLVDVMRSSTILARPGYVYCFSDKSTPDYLKIGFAKASDMNREGPSHRLFQRLSEQVVKCQFDMRLEFYEFMPCGGRKIESLVHATLHAESWTVVRCKSPKCPTQHTEWFKATVNGVKSYIQLWQRFSALRPWTESGALLPEWDARAMEHHQAYGSLSVREWIDHHWKQVLIDAEKAQIEKHSDIQRLQARLASCHRRISLSAQDIDKQESDRCRRLNPNRRADEHLIATKRELNRLEVHRGIIQAHLRRMRNYLTTNLNG